MKQKASQQSHNPERPSPQAKAHGLAIARLLLDSVIREREGNLEGDAENEVGNLPKVDGKGHMERLR